MHAIYVNFLNQKGFRSVGFMSEHLLNLDEFLQAPYCSLFKCCLSCSIEFQVIALQNKRL